MLPVRTASRASVISSSDQCTCTTTLYNSDRVFRQVWEFELTCVFLLSSIPTFLQRPYNVPLGIPNSVAAFCTAMPPRMASSAVLRSSCTPSLRDKRQATTRMCITQQPKQRYVCFLTHLVPRSCHGVEWLGKLYPLLPCNFVQRRTRDFVHLGRLVGRYFLLPERL